jgi:hypothetical protein
VSFKRAVARTPNLQNAWQPGLQALRARDRQHIQPENPRRLRGSADIDAALRATEPRASRWDYAIGYQHTNRREEYIYWVETHTGSDEQIKIVLEKLEWLKNWLRHDGQPLAAFKRDFIWISSGHTLFTTGSAQVKMLAQQGLVYSGSILRIPNQRRP